MYGQSYGNGTAYNEKIAAKPRSTARIYDSIYVRHWDTWLTTTFNAVFSGVLKTNKNGRDASIRYAAAGPLKNLVASVKNLESPCPTFGGPSDYDLSADGKWATFKSKAPELPRANNTASYIYLVPHDGSQKPHAINGPRSPGTPKDVRGDSSSPVFSPDGTRIAYLQMADIAYEADHRALYVHTIGSNKTNSALAKEWDRSPDTIKWTADGKNLVAGTEDRARGRLFLLPAEAGDDFVPSNFTNGGTVKAHYNLPDGDILVTGSTIWSSWTLSIDSPQKGVTKTLLSANEVDPGLKGLGPADINEFYYKGNWTDVSPDLD